MKKNHKGFEGHKHSEEWKQAALGNKNGEGKRSEEFCENQKGNKNGNYKHGKHTKDVKIEKLKTRLRKLEEEK